MYRNTDAEVTLKPFEQLTRRGQARRLRSLALKALEYYDLDVARVRSVGIYTNTLFRVDTTRGKSYIIRVCTPGWRTDEDLASEVMWLLALDRDTDIGAPCPLAARDGTFLVHAEVTGVPGSRRCVVMDWLPGVPLEKRLTEENLYAMGVLFARLHEHGAAFSPPPGFTQRRMDHIYARGEEDVLFSETAWQTFTAHEQERLALVKAKVDDAYTRLYADSDGLRVIHNDLWHGNIKVYYKRLYPLDFEDTVWGYPVQDLAMALQDLMTDVDSDEFEPFQVALRRGYESRLAWPEQYPGHIDVFRAGRMLWVANYVARFQKQYLRPHIEWLTPQLERFLESGRVRKGGE